MRVAFLGNQYLDPDNCRSWSGLPYFMRRALEEAGIETVTIAPQDTEDPRRIMRLLYWRWLRGKRYLKYCDPRLLQDHARQCERRLASVTVDAVFSPSTWPLAYLRTRLPTVFWTDASFAGVLNFYDSFTNVAPLSVAAGHWVEQQALTRCARAIFSSDWAAATARDNYAVDAGKVRVVPFGGNLAEPPTLGEAREFVRTRPMQPCRLLLVGVDWQRKGADIALEVSELLNQRGIECTLTVVGCNPPAGRALPPHVELVPFLGKSSADDRRRLNALYARSHFFVMPTRAEAFGIVYAEAAAFGVPSMATQVGGLPTVIRSGINGELFALDAPAAAYADWIVARVANPAAYRALAMNALEDARERLSWPVAGQRVAAIFEELPRTRTNESNAPIPVREPAAS
ncbi:MAG TPA: glycosyltransferase family 4 protein [Opitutaceae bacterium]|nr:glycosyltransferase family 4 protein [Opitutaceae bacterium]